MPPPSPSSPSSPMPSSPSSSGGRPPVTFPDGFGWGAATSSYQIEGDRAGRGDNIWDSFCRLPGAVRNGDHGDVACDHLRLMADDVALMADLGLQRYRFSFAWPRVLRDGVGTVSQAGLDQYRTLVELLLEHGIEPVPTLFHWDLPQALEDRGGFRVRDAAAWFADYAAVMVAAFGDRITSWATFNEPWCFAYLGHAAGEHAPGRREPAAAVAVAHHQLLAHGTAVDAMRAAAPAGRALSIGIVLNPAPVHVDESLGDDTRRRIDGTLNRWWLDGVLLGRYPVDVLDDLSALDDVTSCVHDGDEAIVGRPIDWLGINYYNDHFFTAAGSASAAPDSGRPSPHVTAPGAVPAVVDRPVTDLGWPITPQGFEQLLVDVHRTYGEALPPIWITENGAAYTDPVDAEGGDDSRRIAYLDAHLRAVASAISRGVDVRSYFAWSLLDNFEWAHGYAQRFGLVHVDDVTRARTPKASARWYADVARTNRLP